MRCRIAGHGDQREKDLISRFSKRRSDGFANLFRLTRPKDRKYLQKRRLREGEAHSKDLIQKLVGGHKMAVQIPGAKEKPPIAIDERPLVFTIGKRPSILRTVFRCKPAIQLDRHKGKIAIARMAYSLRFQANSSRFACMGTSIASIPGATLAFGVRKACLAIAPYARPPRGAIF